MTYKSGKYRKHFSGEEYEYESFLPNPVNRQYTPENNEVNLLLEKAARYLGELNAYSDLVPNIDNFIAMHVRNEAVKSSKIEGTNTSIEETVLMEREIDPGRKDSWKEVRNYIQATRQAIQELQELPICMRLLQNTHKTLLKGVRGEHKQSGEIRTKQNWIGGTSIKTASFIPPHPEDLSSALKDLELFWNNKKLNIQDLIKIAISHYQFETIHPFNDGNGRVGRILIMLHLMEMRILNKPTLYLSDFFEKHRTAYYDAISWVRERDDLDQWLIFFLTGVIETAQKGKDALQKIVKLEKKHQETIQKHGKRIKSANKLLVYCFQNLTFDVPTATKHLELSNPATSGLIKEMTEIGILKEVTGRSRNRMFRLSGYLEIFK